MYHTIDVHRYTIPIPYGVRAYSVTGVFALRSHRRPNSVLHTCSRVLYFIWSPKTAAKARRRKFVTKQKALQRQRHKNKPRPIILCTSDPARRMCTVLDTPARRVVPDDVLHVYVQYTRIVEDNDITFVYCNYYYRKPYVRFPIRTHTNPFKKYIVVSALYSSRVCRLTGSILCAHSIIESSARVRRKIVFPRPNLRIY